MTRTLENLEALIAEEVNERMRAVETSLNNARAELREVSKARKASNGQTAISSMFNDNMRAAAAVRALFLGGKMSDVLRVYGWVPLDPNAHTWKSLELGTMGIELAIDIVKQKIKKEIEL